jgi:hypothetical protein
MGRGPSRIAPEGQKWCPGCQDFLLPDLFSVSKSKKDGLKAHCKGCDSKVNSKFYASCPEQGIDRQYKHNYGIDSDIYRELLKTSKANAQHVEEKSKECLMARLRDWLWITVIGQAK